MGKMTIDKLLAQIAESGELDYHNDLKASEPKAISQFREVLDFLEGTKEALDVSEGIDPTMDFSELQLGLSIAMERIQWAKDKLVKAHYVPFKESK